MRLSGHATAAPRWATIVMALTAATSVAAMETPGAACSPEGGVVCTDSTSPSQYQQCGSGVWTPVEELPVGVYCSIWGSELISTSVTAATTTTAATKTSSSTMVTTTLVTSTTHAATTSTTSVKATTTSAATATSTDWLGDTGVTATHAYSSYSGTPTEFPNPDEWIDFDELWDLLGGDCSLAVFGQNATSAQYVHDQVFEVAQAYELDARIIFAVIIQESTCEIDVSGGGLMQQNMGGISCTPYDESCINESIVLGVAGTSTGIGLLGAISTYTSEYGDYAVYPGLRAYNSGANGVDLSDLSTLPSGYGTAAYVSDVANRLLGVTYIP